MNKQDDLLTKVLFEGIKQGDLKDVLAREGASLAPEAKAKLENISKEELKSLASLAAKGIVREQCDLRAC